MNTTQLIGRLTGDPHFDQFETDSGYTSVAKFRLVPRKSYDGTEFVDVVVFDGQAAPCADLLRKGRQVAVAGRLQYHEWTDAGGAAAATKSSPTTVR